MQNPEEQVKDLIVFKFTQSSYNMLTLGNTTFHVWPIGIKTEDLWSKSVLSMKNRM